MWFCTITWFERSVLDFPTLYLWTHLINHLCIGLFFIFYITSSLYCVTKSLTSIFDKDPRILCAFLLLIFTLDCKKGLVLYNSPQKLWEGINCICLYVHMCVGMCVLFLQISRVSDPVKELNKRHFLNWDMLCYSTTFVMIEPKVFNTTTNETESENYFCFMDKIFYINRLSATEI